LRLHAATSIHTDVKEEEKSTQEMNVKPMRKKAMKNEETLDDEEDSHLVSDNILNHGDVSSEALTQSTDEPITMNGPSKMNQNQPNVPEQNNNMIPQQPQQQQQRIPVNNMNNIVTMNEPPVKVMPQRLPSRRFRHNSHHHNHHHQENEQALNPPNERAPRNKFNRDNNEEELDEENDVEFQNF